MLNLINIIKFCIVRADSIVVLLASCVPQTKIDRPPIRFHLAWISTAQIIAKLSTKLNRMELKQPEDISFGKFLNIVFQSMYMILRTQRRGTSSHLVGNMHRLGILKIKSKNIIPQSKWINYQHGKTLKFVISHCSFIFINFEFWKFLIKFNYYVKRNSSLLRQDVNSSAKASSEKYVFTTCIHILTWKNIKTN